MVKSKTKKVQNSKKKKTYNNTEEEIKPYRKRRSTIKKRISIIKNNPNIIKKNLKKNIKENLKNPELLENSSKLNKEENYINEFEEYFNKIDTKNNFFDDENKMKNSQMKKNLDFHLRIKEIMRLNLDLNKRAIFLFDKIEKSSFSIDNKIDKFFLSLNSRDFKLDILEEEYEKFNKDIFQNNFKKEVNKQLKSFKDLIKDIFKEKKEKIENEIDLEQEEKIKRENKLSEEIEKIKQMVKKEKELELKKKIILEKEKEKKSKPLFDLNEMNLLIKNNNEEIGDYDLRKFRNSALLLNPSDLVEFSKLKEKFKEEDR